MKNLFFYVLTIILVISSNNVFGVKYSSPTILSERVKNGTLPSVENRLPKKPLIINAGSIGNYGGKLKGFVPGPDVEGPETDWIRNQYLGAFSMDLKSIVPNIAETWNLSSDKKKLTVKLREGMKWSDGKNLTTDDVEFYYQAYFLNKNLNPKPNKRLMPGGKSVKINIIDKYTFEYEFSVPYPLILDILPTELPMHPKHYLSKYHIDYNIDANKLAKKDGFSTWWEYYLFKIIDNHKSQDNEYPTLEPWIYDRTDSSSNRYYVRNPFYHKVDRLGNQLPYIDYVERIVVENKQVITGKLLSGTATHASWYVQLPDYPLLKENEKKANIRVDLFSDTRSSEYGFAFNYTHKDKNKKQLFNKLKFRRAMSHAINRDEINELVFLGLAIPRQPIADPTASFFEKGMDSNYIEYNQKLANRLLDELGLKKNGKFRTFSDGSELSLLLEFWSGKANVPEVSELIKGYWEKVGIKTTLKPSEATYYRKRLVANETDLGNWAIGGGSEIYSRKSAPIRWRPPWHWPHTALGGVEWWNWYDSNGQSGEIPPKTIQKLFDLNERWLAEPRGSKEYSRLGKEILKINAENIWLIGTVGLVQRVGVISNKIQNAPKAGSTLSVEYEMWAPYRPEHWWIKE